MSVPKDKDFSKALQGKKIPILTLDNKWYRLIKELNTDEYKQLEKELNQLLKRQGKLNTEIKSIKSLKKKLMSEIVPMVDEAGQTDNAALDDKIQEHKRLIEECNEKLDSHQDEMLDLPREIDRVNLQLMLLTMEYCYEAMQENTESIDEITAWVDNIRVELKKQLIRKQARVKHNQDIYAYMHDIFGADVVDLFDMKYLPKEEKASKE